MSLTKSKPCRAGLVSVPAVLLTIAPLILFRVWVNLGREVDRSERTAVLAIERTGGRVMYLDLKDKSDVDFDRSTAGRPFDLAGKPRIKPRSVNGFWRWPVPWWSARRWTPAAYVGRDVPFTSRGTLWVGGRSILPKDDHDVAPMRVAVDISFVASLFNDRVKHVLTDAEWEYFCRAFPSARSLGISCPVKDAQLRFLKYLNFRRFSDGFCS
jgi:hypothetical protein